MTYYCKLQLSNCPDGGYEIYFSDINVCTQGDDKEHALAMAKEALEGILECGLDKGRDIPLPVNRSDEGLFPIEVEPKIAKRILESKIKALQQELTNLENNVEILDSVQTRKKGKLKTPSLAH